VKKLDPDPHRTQNNADLENKRMSPTHLAPNHIPGLLLDLLHPGVEIADGLVQAGQALLGGEERVDVVHHVQIGPIQRIAARQHLIKGVIREITKQLPICRIL
jgi:hypothetical protein